MKKISYVSPASHPFKDQVFCTHNGFTVEVCRRPESKATAFALRYRAYRNNDSIPANEEELLYDEYDFQAHSQVHLVWYEGKPVATVRACIWSQQYDWAATEAVNYFSQDIKKSLGLRTPLLESNRYAVDPDFQGRKSLFAQILMFRVHALNSAVHRCNHIITSVREKHAPFYRRFLGMNMISDQVQQVSWVDAKVCLLAGKRENCLQTALKYGLPEVTESDIALYARCADLVAPTQYPMVA